MMANENHVDSETSILSTDRNKSNSSDVSKSDVDASTTCQCCCCRFPKFEGSNFKSESSLNHSSEYKPYFEVETEAEKLSYEYFKLLARVTYDEILVKHRKHALEQLHDLRLCLLLEELRLIEETDLLYSSSDECFSEFRIRIPEKRRSLRIKNKKRRFQKQKFRK